MQEEVNEKTVALSIRAGKLTAEVLQDAMRKLLVSQLNKSNTAYRGKQTLKQLMDQNAGVNSIEITDSKIKSFERVAKKYGIDYALKKDAAEESPRYLVFFKGRDVDVLTQAFKEYSAKAVAKQQKPSIKAQLTKALNLVKPHKQREKTRDKDREMDH